MDKQKRTKKKKTNQPKLDAFLSRPISASSTSVPPTNVSNRKCKVYEDMIEF